MKSKILLIVTILLAACDNRDNKTEEPIFVPGDLLIGIESDVSIDLVFDLMNEKGVTIDRYVWIHTPIRYCPSTVWLLLTINSLVNPI